MSLQKQKTPDNKNDLEVKPLTNFGDNGVVVVDSNVYHIVDMELKDLMGEVRETISITRLYPNKTTRGHIHEHEDETYHFMEGTGYLLLQGRDLNKLYRIDPETWQFIPKNHFHMVINTSQNEDLVFETRYPGRSDRPPLNQDIQNGKKKK